MKYPYVILFFYILLINCDNKKDGYLGEQVKDNINIHEISFAFEDTTMVIHPFVINNQKYLMVPSHWDTSQLLFSVNQQGFKPFNDGLEIGPIVIFHSNLPTVCILTESGSLDYVNEKLRNEESGYISITDLSGNIEYEGGLSYIRGRGNGSWLHAKKPYSIKLSQKAKIMNLKEAKKYNLLSQPIDITGLRNWICYNVAKRIGIPNSIDCDFTNLYLNGNYAGCYMITNKVDIGKGGVDIFDLEKETEILNHGSLKNSEIFEKKESGRIIKGCEIINNPMDISGGYLMEFDTRTWTIHNAHSGFQMKYGGNILLKSPKYASMEQVNYIKQYMDRFEDALINYSKGINEDSLENFIDIPSFVKYFLCQEVFENLDAGSSSFYMYKDVNNSYLKGRIVAGPIWDMDRTLFNEDFRMPGYNLPNVIYAGAGILSNDTCFCGILGMLYKNKNFRKEVSETYCNNMKAIVNNLMYGHDLDSISLLIHDDIAVDNLRWHANINGEIECKRIKEMFRKRLRYLDLLWIVDDSIEKCNVTVECCPFITPHLFMYPKKKGDSFNDKLPDFGRRIGLPSGYEYEFVGWTVDGEFVDLENLKIDKDIYIKAEWKIINRPSFIMRIKSKFENMHLYN